MRSSFAESSSPEGSAASSREVTGSSSGGGQAARSLEHRLALLVALDDLGVHDLFLLVGGAVGRRAVGGRAIAGRRLLLGRGVDLLGHLVEGDLQRLGLRVQQRDVVGLEVVARP